MTTRRQFLRGAASGLVFCSCGLHAARAQSLASARTGGGDAGDDPSLNYKHPDWGKKRAPVVIDGRPIKTIDVHAHCFFHEAVAMAGPGVSVNSAVKAGRSSSRTAMPTRSIGGWATWMPKGSTWKCCRSIPSGTARTATSRSTSSTSTTPSSRNSVPPIPNAFPPSPRSPCSIRTSRSSSFKAR